MAVASGAAIAAMRRHGARGDMRGGANRRAGAGDDAAPRIVGARDEAEPFGIGGKAVDAFRGAMPIGQQRAARRGAKAAGAGVSARHQPICSSDAASA